MSTSAVASAAVMLSGPSVIGDVRGERDVEGVVIVA